MKKGLVIRPSCGGYFLCDGQPPRGCENDEGLYIGNTVKWFESWEEAEAMLKMIDATYGLQKIAAYEDIGLSPEEVVKVIKSGVPEWNDKYLEYRKLESEGRLVVLPCKVGDTVYKLCPANPNITVGQLWDGKIVKNNCDRCAYGRCGCVGISSGKTPLITTIEYVSKKWIWNHRKDFGKTIFLTHAEAEAMLKMIDEAHGF